MGEERFDSSPLEIPDARYVYLDTKLLGIGVVIFLDIEEFMLLNESAVPACLAVLLPDHSGSRRPGEGSQEFVKTGFQFSKRATVSAARVRIGVP